MHANQSLQSAVPEPWWKFGYVWMVIAGPASVLLASIATVWITLANPDTLVAQDYYRRGMQINKTLADQAQRERDRALMPALQGRNHAASPAPAGLAPTAVPGEVQPVPQPTVLVPPPPATLPGLLGPSK